MQSRRQVTDCQVWAYLRVSSEPQAEKGTPLPGQLQAIERYCQEHGYRLERIFKDEAVSDGCPLSPGEDRGAELSKRPAAARARRC